MEKKYVIDRKRWLRGTGGEFSSLLNSQRNGMCCMGHICQQEGVSDVLLEGKLTPVDAIYSAKKKNLEVPKVIYDFFTIEVMPPTEERPILEDRLDASCLSNHAACINDDEELSDETREERLKILFKEKGVELEFFGPTREQSQNYPDYVNLTIESE